MSVLIDIPVYTLTIILWLLLLVKSRLYRRPGQEKGKLARNNNKSGPENNNLATTEWEMQEKELSIFNFIFLS